MPPTFPLSAIGQINIENAYICSGALVGPNQVLTAAHCAYGRGVNGSAGVRLCVCGGGRGRA